MRSIRETIRLIAIGWPRRSTIQPRRGGISRICTRLLSESSL
jgi:hypothetical protein